MKQREANETALKDLKRDKLYAKATHKKWGALLAITELIKPDDGEQCAGIVILRMLEREGFAIISSL